MPFIADFHIHSRYSMATSKDCTPPELARSARVKGLSVLGTGDFTHPAWRRELYEWLEPDDSGLYRPRTADADSLRFVISGEISSIYKKNGRTRKVHSLILLPSLEAADRIAGVLETIGNIRADGRPILGLDARKLLEICLEIAPDVIFIPAHIWTPHFSVLGAASGFDSLDECFEDLTPHITAVETGLSSDPAMNWRLSALDRYTLVSNSDAHSPRNLAREANLFDCPRTYEGIRDALATRVGFLGTLEFFPEEGKYHLDGHRNCGVSLSPEETETVKGICPKCGGKLTMGVLHRVAQLADRAPGFLPDGAPGFDRLVPLETLIASALGVRGGKSVAKLYDGLLAAVGSELVVLREQPVEDISRVAGPLVAEAIRRSRAGDLHIAAGYDGQYGVIDVFKPGEREAIKKQGVLFESLPEFIATPMRIAAPEVAEVAAALEAEVEYTGGKSGPTDSQKQAIEAGTGPVVIMAGPGSGKTSTLVARIEHLIAEKGVSPETVTAVTFTRRAAAELRDRLNARLGAKTCKRLNVGTFHQLALEILRVHYGEAMPRLISEVESREYILQAAEEAGCAVNEPARQIGLLKADGSGLDAAPGAIKGLYRAYNEILDHENAMDFDDVLIRSLEIMRAGGPAWQALRARYGHLLVDEFQDVNRVQYDWVLAAVSDPGNLFVIGDPDQSIYAFRGSDHRLFESLTVDFPETRIIRLAENFRSATPIVEAAAAVIARNPGPARTLVPVRHEAGRVRHLIVPDETSEGIAIVQAISQLLGGTDMLAAHGQGRRGKGNDSRLGLGFSDFAVLFRTGKQAERLEECFLKEGLPYRVVGRESFLEAETVRLALACLRTVANPASTGDYAAYLAMSAPDGETARVKGLLHQDNGPGSLLSEPPEWVSTIDAELEEMRRMAAHSSATALIEAWAERHGCADDPSVRRLARLAWGGGTLLELLSRVAEGREGDLQRMGFNSESAEAVSLMTLHASKGLEFPAVFLAGAEEGLLPFGEDPGGEQLQEERRLFYVGMTRACRDLIIVSCRRRFWRGELRTMQASRFANDMPARLVESDEWKPRETGRQMRLFGSTGRDRG